LKFKRSLEDDSEIIPTSSMADITFLLIIFFMVGTVFNVEKGIEMTLPQSTVQQDISEENVIISIDNAEKLFLDGEPVELASLGQMTLDKVTTSPESFILIKSDQGVKYRIVIDVLDELLQVGITNIALPTEEENP
jgi:biopolymer transport protein ExbD